MGIIPTHLAGAAAESPVKRQNRSRGLAVVGDSAGEQGGAGADRLVGTGGHHRRLIVRINRDGNCVGDRELAVGG